MGSPRARLAIAMALATIPVACAPAPAPISGEHDGLVVEGRVAATDASITVDLSVRNKGDGVLHLEPNQCGRVTDVRLERTQFRAEGRHWDGPVQAAKELVLHDQRFEDDSDLFAPRRVGDTSSATPDCARPDHAIALDPGATIAERWELPIRDSRTLREVGSNDAVVSLEAIEARDPDTMEYFDIVYFLDRAKDREGREARAELPLSQVLHRAATDPVTGPSRGELFDRLLENDALRAWIEAQPADGWGDARLQPVIPGAGPAFERVRLEMVSRAFEHSAVVTADADGSNATLDLPGEEDRTRVFARTAGTLPPGIQAFPDATWVVTDDLQFGTVLLPSGRLVVDEFPLGAEPLDIVVAPGAYATHATLARQPDQEGEQVAFASVVLSDAPTVRWQNEGAIAVDGGTTMLTSVEANDALGRTWRDDTDTAERLDREIYDSMVAHDYLGTEWALSPETNLVRVTSGVGDGGYPVYVGFDTDGNPTRVVVDFLLLHLGWPGA